jgi:hypothetical protein
MRTAVHMGDHGITYGHPQETEHCCCHLGGGGGFKVEELETALRANSLRGC